MTLRRRAQSRFKKLSMPISYRVMDDGYLYDARNVFDNKGVTDTRHGIKRYNSTAIEDSGFVLDESSLDVDVLGLDSSQVATTKILSGSFFKNTSGSTYRIVKVGASIRTVTPSGRSVVIKDSLSFATKHRGITLNNRHIIAVENDGLFSFNGTTFTQLGQDPPALGTATISSGGSLVDTNSYKVGLTFYSTATGFETNVYESNQVTAANPSKQIDVTAIPTTAANGTVDKVRVYLKNVTTSSSYLFVAEISLGIATYTIASPPTSTQVPPTVHGAPLSGGGKYIATFGSKVVYAGNSNYPNDVFFSEDYLPDAFNSTSSAVILHIDGDGPITGIGTGLYNNNYLSPFLAVFKKTSTTIYSNLGGVGVQTTIDSRVGCISHDTIKVRNGVIYFMSENGWYGIKNGSIIRGDDGIPVSLGNGAIDDIFSRDGWSNQINTADFSSFFSAYYSTLGHYLTFVSEGANTSIVKAYNYEERIGGFRVYEFKLSLTCAFEGEDENGRVCIYLGGPDGFLFTHSVSNPTHDEDIDGVEQSIPAFAYLPYVATGDDSSTYNWRTLTVRAIAGENPISVRAFPGYALRNEEINEYDFSNSEGGFVLDVSQLDIDLLGDDRVPVTYSADINRTGESMLIGFFQDEINSKIGLISSQLDFNKNGNRNI